MGTCLVHVKAGKSKIDVSSCWLEKGKSWFVNKVPPKSRYRGLNFRVRRMSDTFAAVADIRHWQPSLSKVMQRLLWNWLRMHQLLAQKLAYHVFFLFLPRAEMKNIRLETEGYCHLLFLEVRRHMGRLSILFPLTIITDHHPSKYQRRKS